MTQPTDDDEPTWVNVVATCHTDGCGNAGAAIPLTTVEDATVVCGVCGETIDDVVPA